MPEIIRCEKHEFGETFIKKYYRPSRPMYVDNEFRDAMDCWDAAMRTLAAGPRRQIILELLMSPDDAPLPLPEGVIVPGVSLDPDQITLGLIHHHLPFLAQRGYVTWEQEPFTVKPGPRFDDVASIMEILWQSRDVLPPTLWNDSVYRNVTA